MGLIQFKTGELVIKSVVSSFFLLFCDIYFFFLASVQVQVEPSVTG